MQFPCKFVLFTLFWRIASIEGKDGCKVMEYLDCIPNKALISHVIKTSTVPQPGLHMCQNSCFNEDQCMSYNLGPVDGGIRACELSIADHWMRPSSLVSKDGFEYCPIENPCSSKPCPSYRLCTPNLEWNTYSCNDGAWASWSIWSGCTDHLCPRVRKRNCTDPAPRNNGANCNGVDRETKECPVISADVLTGCNGALGMEDGRIEDQQITVSSRYSGNYPASDARLHKTGAGVHGWAPKSSNVRGWIQLDFLNETIITKVATQGTAATHDEYITQYAIAYSNDDKLFSEDACVKTYTANIDKINVVVNSLDKPIQARYIRLFVKSFHTYPTMRMEVYGCTP